MNHDDRLLTTDEVARILRVKPQTIRLAHSRCGHYLGIRPLKLGNRLLRWNRADVERVLKGNA